MRKYERKVKDYTLNDVGKILDVHRDTIVYWEERGHIPKPRRHPENNYRIYNEEEVWEIARLRGISNLDFEAVSNPVEKNLSK